MKAVALLCVVLIVVLAAITLVGDSLDPFSLPRTAAAIILILAVTLQRIAAIHRWISPRHHDPAREREVQAVAEGAYLRFCSNLPISRMTQSVYVHVWEVPLWYRKAFSYRTRNRLRALARRPRFQRFQKRTIRPALHRLAAVGLFQPEETGVRLTKGIGVVGIALAENNDEKRYEVDTRDPRYRAALAGSDDEWRKAPFEITRGLSRADAQLLADKYNQVVAKVIKRRGEAIGCVTISTGEAAASLDLLNSVLAEEELRSLVRSVREILAS